MKKIFLLIIGTLILLACNDKKYSMNENFDYKIDFVEVDRSYNADKIYLRFNILDKTTNEKVNWSLLKKENIEILSGDKDLAIENVQRVIGSGGQTSENILVSLLVDKSINANEMTKLQDAVGNIVNSLPNNSVYISFFDEQLRNTKKITRENFNEFQSDFSATKNNKILFDIALKKLQELNGEKGFVTEQEMIGKIENDAVKKYLVILTDGKVDANHYRTAENIQKFSDYIQKIDNDAANKKQIEIHAIRFGELTEDVDQTLSYLCVSIRNDNVKGGLYIASPDDFINKLKVNDVSHPDYELAISNAEGKVYNGAKKELALKITANNKIAFGVAGYSIGALSHPVKSSASDLKGIKGFKYFKSIKSLAALKALGAPLFIIASAFLILLIIIPFIRFKAANFNKKYVRLYSIEEDTIVRCHYCLNELRDGEDIVTKCNHTVHLHCWIQNGYKCADYGENCKQGKQYFFDVKKPLKKENRPFYMTWALYGMTGGAIAALCYQLISFYFPYLFEPLSEKLFEIFYPGSVENAGQYLQSIFNLKSGSLMLTGLLSGLILVFLFAKLNKNRQKTRNSMAWILLKSVFGAFSGFIAGLIGAIIFILFKADANSIFIDWIPWILFGISLCLSVSLFTNTVFKRFLLGCVISGLLCFFVLLTGEWIGFNAVLIGLMIFGAGAGFSFITSRRTINKYYLKYKGNKEGIIAIHKWMSVAGGSNDVLIGKSENCTIRMSWDEHPSILNEHVKLFFDRKDKVPCLKVLADSMIFNKTIAKSNDEFVLKPGVRFNIGNTEFQYLEK